MPRWMGWIGSWACVGAGCKSDSKLGDELDPGLVPGLTTDPGGTTGTDADTDTDPPATRRAAATPAIPSAPGRRPGLPTPA